MQKCITILLLVMCHQLKAQVPDIDSLLAVTNVPKDDTGKVIAYRILTGIITPQDPVRAIGYGKKGIALGKRLGFDKGVAGCFLNTGFAYSSAGQLNEALLYVDSAITWAEKVGEPARIALAYLNRADYNRQLVRMKQALIDCDTALVYAEKAKKDDTRARIFQTIGSIHHAQGDYVQSKTYYEKAFVLYEKANNTQMIAISLNNLGNIYKGEKKYEQAVANYNNAIRIAEKAGDKSNMAMFYSNISNAYYEQKKYPESEKTVLKSLEHARQQDNTMQIADAQALYAMILLKMTRVDESLKQAGESYALASKEELVDLKEIAAQMLAEGNYLKGNYKEAYKYLQESKSIADTLARQKFEDEVASLQTNMQFNEKNKEIGLLNKDSQLQQQQLKDQRIIMMAGAAIALLLLLGVWLLVNRYRLQQRMKAMELRQQIAADLHDEVGSSLSSIHMLSQMATQQGDELKQQDILRRMSNNVKETMESMGDIVWMIKPNETRADSLQQRMERFAHEISKAKNIRIDMEINDLQKAGLDIEQRKNIYLIFKEALNNAAKYSDTEKIIVLASLPQHKLIMQVRDFGKGFDTGNIKEGNGLDNMRRRAKDVGGRIDIHSDPTGTIILLEVQI